MCTSEVRYLDIVVDTTGEPLIAYESNGVHLAIGVDILGVNEQGALSVTGPNWPTILRAPDLARVEGRVLDVQGRDVTDERRALSPGVYFLIPKGPRGQGAKGPSVRKVIIAR